MLRSLFTPVVRSVNEPADRLTVIQRAISLLSRFGSDAHLWLPGGDVKTYGPELVTNGGFDSDTSWTKGTGWSIGAGVASCDGTQSAHSDLSQAIVFSNSGWYEITLTVNRTAGNYNKYLANTEVGGWSTSSGTFTYSVQASTTDILIFRADADFIGTIDNISVREITSITPTITSGLTTGNYLESTGTTLGTVDNPVGLVLDALGAVGAALTTIGTYTAYNSTMTNGGVLPSTATSTIAGNYGFMVAGALTAGVTYRATLTWSGNSLGRNISLDGGAGAALSNAVSGTATYFFKSTDVQHFIYIVGAAAAGESFTAVSCTMEPVTGTHATQSTTANKPVLRRGATNLLLNSVLAGGTSGVEGSGAVAPTSWAFGSATGSVTFSDGTVRFVATAQRPFITETYTAAVGAFCASCRVVSKNATTVLQDIIAITASTATLTSQSLKINNVTAPGTTEVNVGDVVSYIATVTVAGTFGVRIGLGCNGNVTGDVTLSQPQLELGSTASAYSPTTTAAASNPSAGRYSWGFDGSNDSLTLGSVPFQMSDDHCVIAGARCDSASGDRTVFSIRSTASGNPIVASLDFSSGVPRAYWRDDAGTGAAGVSGTAIATDCVLSNRKVGNAKLLRVNGVTQGTTSAVVGTATLTSAAIGVSPVGTPNSYMNGYVGSVLTIKGTVTDAELLLLERFVAALTPNAPVF